ncbi:MAG: sensor histidine kinase [Lachnotalea sp.]
MRQLKLQTKLFIAYVGLSVLILLAFSIFFYKYVSQQLIKQELHSIAVQNTYFQTQVEEIINDMDTVSININYSNLVKAKLDTSFNLNISRDTLDDLASLFVTINGADIKVDQINLYDLVGNMLKVGIKTNTDKVDVDSLTWFNDVLKLDGAKLISEPYETSSLSTSSYYSDWFISVYRSYNNHYGRTVGAVETVKFCKNVFKSIISYKKKNKDLAQVYIYSEDHKLIYPYDLTIEEQNAIPAYYSYMQDDIDYVAIHNPNTDSKEYLAYTSSTYTNWTYITVQPESYILKPVNQLLDILFLFVLALLVASLFISYFLSKSLVKPIKHLKHIIQRIELDSLGEQTLNGYPTSYNEFLELHYAFQLMSDKLKISMNELIESREQELKSRTLALQTQINPHFYYNTLSSIMVLTENERPQEVISMCRYLSQIMRYITDSSTSFVSIQKELDYVDKYLYCMKVRYQTSLNYTIDIDNKLLELLIPKLLIQPIVENAIKYGTNCIPPWNISIIGRIYDTHWQIDIIDTGNGFTDDDIIIINERIHKVDINPGMQEMHVDGLGMINVYMRWKLFCQNAMIFNYGNTKEGHGIVSIGKTLIDSKEELQ